MSSDTDSKPRQLWERFADKSYRESFVASYLATNIAAQIFGMREASGWSQRKLAAEAGMAQARISVVENVGYESFTVSTLKRIASAFDVALIVRFVPFSRLAEIAASTGPEELAPVGFKNDVMPDLSKTRGAFPSGVLDGIPTRNNAIDLAAFTRFLNPGQTIAGPAVGSSVRNDVTIASSVASMMTQPFTVMQ